MKGKPRVRKLLTVTTLLAISLSACANAGGDNNPARAAAARAAASAGGAALEAQEAMDTLRSSTARLCESESVAAEKIMTARQAGVAMSTVMDVAEKQGEPYIGYVRAAYEMPRLSTDSAKEAAQGEFRDNAYAGCLRRWEF